MKKNILFLLTGIVLFTLIGAGTLYQVRKNTAEVPSHMGVYIFYDNMPVMEYETLGEIKVTFTNSQRYNDVREAIVKKAKRTYPDVEGVIIYPASSSLSAERATAIRFK